jgi:hypothetical protein
LSLFGSCPNFTRGHHHRTSIVIAKSVPANDGGPVHRSAVAAFHLKGISARALVNATQVKAMPVKATPAKVAQAAEAVPHRSCSADLREDWRPSTSAGCSHKPPSQ